jgi:hypothetical protein
MKPCWKSLNTFNALWPEGCLVTVENVRLARQQYLPPHWFCVRFIRKSAKVHRWYRDRLDAAWHTRCIKVNRSWAANRAYDEAHDRIIVMAINKVREGPAVKP